MQDSHTPLGKRERNKIDKLGRIVDVATELFEAEGVDNVTMHQIADRAQIGKGTLFLYARNKGELVLLVQNAHYAAALERGKRQAAFEHEPVKAVESIVREIVLCNRIRVDNGRNYLHEILFGSVDDPNRKESLRIVADADEAIADIISGGVVRSSDTVLKRAQLISDTMFMTMALSENVRRDNEEIVTAIMQKAALVIPGGDTANGQESRP